MLNYFRIEESVFYSSPLVVFGAQLRNDSGFFVKLGDLSLEYKGNLLKQM